MNLKIGSLFSGGLGGLEYGLEAAGLGHTIWQCEIDPEARRNLRRHWPGVPQYDDVRTLNGREVEPVDILCGGFPCVGTSSAGKGHGLDDPRSGLWREYARLIGEFRPRYVVIENTPLLPTRGLEQVLQDLANHGYDAFWFHLRASDVGAPHKRQRIFIVAWRRELADSRSVRLEGLEPNGPTPETVERSRRAEVVDAHGRGRDERARQGHLNGGRHRPSDPGSDTQLGLARGVDAERQGGAGDVAREAGRAQGEGLQHERGGDDAGDSGQDGREALDHAHGDGPQGQRLRGILDGVGSPYGDHAHGPSRSAAELEARLGEHVWPPGPDDRDGWREHLKRFPYRAPAALAPPAKPVSKRLARPMLNPVFVESLMGVPEDWTSGKRKDRLIHLGNGVVPHVARVVGEVVRQLDERLRPPRKVWGLGVGALPEIGFAEED